MIDQIRERYWAKSFIPFTIHLSDGRAFTVSHPESMAQGPDGRTIAVYLPDGVCHFINVALVTDVSVSSKAGANN